MDNTDDSLVIIGAPIDTPKLYSEPADDTSYYLGTTPRTVSTSALSPSTELSAALTYPFKSHNKIESIQ